MATKKPAPAAKKSKASAADVDDLLGGTPAKKTPAKKAAAAEATAAPAKKVAAKKAAPAADKEPRARREGPKFEDGERDAIREGVRGHFKKSKKAIASKELAEKLGTETRKLRAVIYGMAKKNEVTITLEGSRAAGMTVGPATAA